MKSRQIIGISLVSALFFLNVIGWRLSYAADLTPPPTNTCLQEQLVLLENRLISNHFEVDRTIRDFRDTIGESFTAALDSLGPEDVWFDFGSGRGYSAARFLQDIALRRPSQIPTAIGIVHTKASNAAIDDAGLKYLVKLGKFKEWAGRYVEDIPLGEFPKMSLGTDYYGPLSYTHRMSDLLRKYFEIMTPHKSTLFVVMFEPGVQTEIVTKNGTMTFSKWLETIPGISVRVRKSPTHFGEQIIQITKLSNTIHIPELELIDLMDGAPPVRIFKVITPKSPAQ